MDDFDLARAHCTRPRLPGELLCVTGTGIIKVSREYHLLQIIRHKTEADFLQRAGAWLEEAEAENNPILGIAARLRDDSAILRIAPYYITLEKAGHIVGVAFMHPPRQLILTHMANEALIGLTDYLLTDTAPVSGVNGPQAEAELFAERWAAKTGKRQRLKMTLGIYACEKVTAAESSPGGLRAATKDDESLLTDGAGELARNAGLADESGLMKVQVPDLTAKRRLYVWKDRDIVSMAGLPRETSHGFAVGLVYTSPSFRRKGFAGSCVAALTQRTPESGKIFCCLYADLANQLRIASTRGSAIERSAMCRTGFLIK
jgi:hypothetical protein